jgi:hypothetical protein
MLNKYKLLKLIKKKMKKNSEKKINKAKKEILVSVHKIA